MKKTYSSPRLTELGPAEEIEKLFGFPSEEETEVALETAVDSPILATVPGSDLPRVG